MWEEDAKGTPWTKPPEAVDALALLRVSALNLAVVLRSGVHVSAWSCRIADRSTGLCTLVNIWAMLGSCTRRQWDYEKPRWKEVKQAVRSVLADPAKVLVGRSAFV